MKYILASFVFLFSSLFVFSQKTKKVTLKRAEGMIKEVFFVHRNDTSVRENKYQEFFEEKLITEGNYKNGLKDGLWNYYSYNGKSAIMVTYLNGLKHGLSKYFVDKRMVYEAEFKNGSRAGKSRRYFSDGLLKSDGTYLDGKAIDTTRVYYHKNHQLKSESIYMGGNQKITEYYSSGKLKRIAEYHGDSLYNVILLNDSSGKKLDAGTFFNGNGIKKSYFMCGMLESEVEFKNGYIDGVVVYYNPDGTIFSKGYEDNHNHKGLWQFYKNNKIDHEINVDTVSKSTKYSIRFTPDYKDSLMYCSLPVDYDDQFVVVEVMPEFPGGVGKMYEFISKEIRYPASCRKKEITGKVFLQFTVNNLGYIGDIKVLRTPNELLSDEGIRVLKLMPRWSPGLQDYIPVSVYFNLPITFKLK